MAVAEKNVVCPLFMPIYTSTLEENMKKHLTKLFIPLLLAIFVLHLIPKNATAALRTRIVVLPFYVEQGSRDAQEWWHFL